MHNVKIIPHVKYRKPPLGGKTRSDTKKPLLHRVGRKAVAGCKYGLYTIRDLPRLVKQIRIGHSLRYHQRLFDVEQHRIDLFQPEINNRRAVRGEKQRSIDATTMELDTRVLKALNEQRRLAGIIMEKRKALDNILR